MQLGMVQRPTLDNDYQRAAPRAASVPDNQGSLVASWDHSHVRAAADAQREMPWARGSRRLVLHWGAYAPVACSRLRVRPKVAAADAAVAVAQMHSSTATAAPLVVIVLLEVGALASEGKQQRLARDARKVRNCFGRGRASMGA